MKTPHAHRRDRTATTLADFRPQRVNANTHTPRGLGMLDAAMAQDGYVAPMTAAADGEIIDGSARLELAAERFAGVAPIVVPHDGTRPIIAVRTDIPNASTPEAKRIALAANRIAQADLQWSPEILSQIVADMVTGAPPQLKVTSPPPARATLKAASVQLAAEPMPTTPAAPAVCALATKSRAERSAVDTLIPTPRITGRATDRCTTRAAYHVLRSVLNVHLSPRIPSRFPPKSHRISLLCFFRGNPCAARASGGRVATPLQKPHKSLPQRRFDVISGWFRPAVRIGTLSRAQRRR